MHKLFQMPVSTEALMRLNQQLFFLTQRTFKVEDFFISSGNRLTKYDVNTLGYPQRHKERYRFLFRKLLKMLDISLQIGCIHDNQLVEVPWSPLSFSWLNLILKKVISP